MRRSPRSLPHVVFIVGICLLTVSLVILIVSPPSDAGVSKRGLDADDMDNNDSTFSGSKRTYPTRVPPSDNRRDVDDNDYNDVRMHRERNNRIPPQQERRYRESDRFGRADPYARNDDRYRDSRHARRYDDRQRDRYYESSRDRYDDRYGYDQPGRRDDVYVEREFIPTEPRSVFDNFREYGSRVTDSIWGSIFGVLLVGGSCWLLFWNEGNTVRNHKNIAEAKRSFIELGEGEIPGPLHDKKLVFLTGELRSTSNKIVDPETGIEFVGAARVERKIEMLQWVEQVKHHTRKVRGGEERETEYIYRQEWKTSPVSSDNFRISENHKNPAFPFSGTVMEANSLSVLQVLLSPSMRARLSCTEPYMIDEDHSLINRVNELVTRRSQGTGVQLIEYGFAFGFWQNSVILRPCSRIDPYTLFLGYDASSPVVGDVRISYRICPMSSVTVMGQYHSNGKRFSEFRTSVGKDIEIAAVGIHTPEQIFDREMASVTFASWALRVVGILLCWMACSMITGPISAVVDFVPLVGSLVNVLLGISSLFIALFLSITVIAFAWLFYRPLVAFGLVGGISFVCYIFGTFWSSSATGSATSGSQ